MKSRDVGQTVSSFQLSTFHLTNYGSILSSVLHLELISASDKCNSHPQESSAYGRIPPIIAQDRDSAELDFHLRDVTIERESDLLQISALMNPWMSQRKRAGLHPLAASTNYLPERT